MDNDEIVGAGEEAISSIESAISELKGIKQYEDTIENLTYEIEVIKEIIKPFEEALQEEWEAENRERNREFERSRF